MPVPIALALWLVFRRGTLVVVAAAALLAVTLGFAAAKLRTGWVAAPVLERPLNLVEVQGLGRTRRAARRARPAHHAARGGDPRLDARATAAIAFASARWWRCRICCPGDAVRLRASLAPPAIPALPGDYDFARAAFFQRLGGVGYALARPERDPRPRGAAAGAAFRGGDRRAFGRRSASAFVRGCRASTAPSPTP